MFRHDQESDAESSDDDSDEDKDKDEGYVKDLIPILEKFKVAVEKFDVLLQKWGLKCKQCDFEAKDANGLVMHVKSKHKK